MGSCVLDGLRDAASPSNNESIRVSKVLACVTSPTSCQKLQVAYHDMGDSLCVSSGANVEAMRQANVILLGCKPHMVENVLQEKGAREALDGKLVISILAGTPVSLLHQYLRVPSSQSATAMAYIMRAIPNLGAQRKVSMTLIEEPKASMPQAHVEMVSWIFSKIGHTKYIPQPQFNAATAVVTSSIAVTSVLLDGILDGAVAAGLKRAEALDIAAHGLLATARLLIDEPSWRPSTIQEMMASPQGVTIQAILKAEDGNVRRSAAETVIWGSQYLEQMSRARQEKHVVCQCRHCLWHE